jgi:pimeloyl-ACP methyl ester carboxylesterase
LASVEGKLMPAVEHDGSKLVFEDRGNGSPPIVFVHGWGGSQADFRPQLEHFASSHRVVAIDLPGHGRSSPGGTPLAIERLADDVMWLVEEVGLERPVLVGHSVGGTIVLDAAARNVGAVAGIVMLDPVILFPPPVIEGFRPAVEALRSPAWLTVFRGFIESWTDDQEERGRRAEQAKAIGQDVIASIGEHGLAYIADQTVTAVSVACDTPMLYVGGNQPVDVGLLRKLCPRARAEMVSGVGHYIQLRRPQEVNRLIGDFVLTLRGFAIRA